MPLAGIHPRDICNLAGAGEGASRCSVPYVPRQVASVQPATCTPHSDNAINNTFVSRLDRTYVFGSSNGSAACPLSGSHERRLRRVIESAASTLSAALSGTLLNFRGYSTAGFEGSVEFKSSFGETGTLKLPYFCSPYFWSKSSDRRTFSLFQLTFCCGNQQIVGVCSGG